MREVSKPKYLMYRCYKCGAPITALQIEANWAKAPEDPKPGESVPLCACGSSHISPGNAKWWEELLYPSIWKLWFYKVLLPWWRSR
jgi:hypothetical protein